MSPALAGKAGHHYGRNVRARDPRSTRSSRHGGGARLAIAGAVLAVALLSTACGSSAAAPSAAADHGPTYEVQLQPVGSLGKVLVNGKGRTLYLFVPDKQGPSVCYGLCVNEWPPLVLPKGVTRPVAGPGINPALLGTTMRKGGQLQVTYNRWPLYFWVADTGPGQASGQGVNDFGGLWWVVDKAGNAIT